MQLTVKIVPDTGMGHRVLLCDEAGKPLPNQLRTVLDTYPGDLPKITVEFIVDGKTISMVPSD